MYSEQTFTRDELKKLTKDQLYQICVQQSFALIPRSITTNINQQLFGVVSLMFNNVKLRALSKDPQIGYHLDRLTSVWCPIKHIVKLTVNMPIFEYLMKQQSAHLAHILSTVENLNILHDTNYKRLQLTSIKNFGIIAKPRSLCLKYLTLDSKQLNAICSIKSLQKIEIWNLFERTCDYFTVLCNGLPLLESLRSNSFDVSRIPKSSRSTIKKLSEVSLKSTNETFEFPNLQKLSMARLNYNLENIKSIFFKYFSQSNNITHLSVYLKFKINIWAPIIRKLRCIVTLEDLEPHRQYDRKEFSKLRDVILPASLSRIIICTMRDFDPNNYLIDIGYQYSKDDIRSYDCMTRKMIFNKIIKKDLEKQCSIEIKI
ncbi:hypothetical protein PPL_03311 [Heterostelium album PN500]|uniref:Uncharacterized protein n=1 Tax=Heterostelium pallidum (strain ATCC 26659 / Pp 5 / PN500) TaxID=670386 RepID=D3B4I6_HETP5|nr:hypothetical protein PPL_03311 [Heterostelium album PN500]EFA84234.1 hypothetical protein PPL_03311 [Heterostelium album PN500]|eukprot:XP_020436350.1 hypothetical protein PPL_03311 [Heterostelium album PN500]